jgi:hypothetical protein
MKASFIFGVLALACIVGAVVCAVHDNDLWAILFAFGAVGMASDTESAATAEMRQKDRK